MSSKELSVIREQPSAVLFRPEWETPEIPDGHVIGPLYYNEAIGYVISRYNDLEANFRGFVSYVAGLRGKKGHALLTHVGAVTLIEACKSLSKEMETPEVIKEEIRYLCDLFNVNRINRNFIAHSSTGSSIPINGPYGDGKLMTRRTSRGSVRTDHYLASISAFRETADQILDCQEYIMLATGPLALDPIEDSVALPHRPPLPKYLAETLPKGEFSDLIHIQQSQEDSPE